MIISASRFLMSRSIIVFIVVQALCVALFWYQGEHFLAANGPTFDEPVHLAAGHSYWTKADFRLNIEDPPLPKLLWAIPGLLSGRDAFLPDPDAWARNDQWRMGHDFLYGEAGRVERLLPPARRMNMLFGVGVIVLAGLWAGQLWNSWLCGAFTSAFAACDPTLIAISAIISTDAALTFFTLLTSYCIWTSADRPNTVKLLAVGIPMGCLLSSKFSAVLAVLGLAFGLFAYLLNGGSFDVRCMTIGSRLKSALTPAVRIIIIALITLAGTYFFIRFPDWGRGLKFQLTRSEHGDPHYYLLGEVRSRGSPWYFLVALVLKLPLGLIMLFMASIAAFRLRHPDSRWPLFFFPPIVYFVLITISGVNLGVRIALPVLPFVWIMACRFVVVGRWHVLRIAFGMAALLFAGVSGLRQSPYPLSYFNELITSPEGALESLGDSNLDWGQGMPAIQTWIRQQGVSHIALAFHGDCPPEYYGIRSRRLPSYHILEAGPDEPLPADDQRHIVMISATCRQGIYLNPEKQYHWLAKRKPMAILAGSIWVYEFAPSEWGLLEQKARGADSP